MDAKRRAEDAAREATKAVEEKLQKEIAALHAQVDQQVRQAIAHICHYGGVFVYKHHRFSDTEGEAGIGVGGESLTWG